MCYTRSFDSYFFLGSLRISIFTLLEEIEDERVYPEIIVYLFPLDCAGWLWSEVVKHTVNAAYFCYDSLSDVL